MKTKLWDEPFSCWACAAPMRFGEVIDAALANESCSCAACRAPIRLSFPYVRSAHIVEWSVDVSWSADLGEELIERLGAAIRFAKILADGFDTIEVAVELERLASTGRKR